MPLSRAAARMVILVQRAGIRSNDSRWREALRAHTWGAAYAAGLEDRMGMLKPGYCADLAVLDRDVFALPPEALLETQVLRVMVGGSGEMFECAIGYSSLMVIKVKRET